MPPSVLIAALLSTFGPATAPSPDDPLAGLARMVGGDWRMTAQNGNSIDDTWHWGPGRHSLRVTSDGLGANGQPWRELQVFYWHPGLEQVRLLGLSPYDRGVAQGTATLDADSVDIRFDMHQARGPRRLRSRWTFDGPGKYHESLLEATGPDTYMPLADWDLDRIRTPHTPTNDQAPELPDRLKPLQPLLGPPWRAQVQDNGNTLRLQTAFERVPYADAIYARVVAPGKDDEPRHLLDAYLYHHTGANSLRCLALSEAGGVYEGNVSVIDGHALQLDLKGDEGGKAAQRLVRLDFEPDGALRQRVWSVDGPERSLILDTRHERSTAPAPPPR